MSAAEDGAEKSYAPTPKRLEDARKKGDIPLAAELTTAAGFGGFVIVAMGFGAMLLVALASELSGYLRWPAVMEQEPVPAASLLRMALLLAPWFVVPAACVLLALFAQSAPTFTPDKVQFKSARLSPLSNAKQKLGKNGLVAFAKAVLKLLVHAVVIGGYVWSQMPVLLALAQLSAGPGTAAVLDVLGAILLRVLLVMAIFAVADLLWQRHSHRQKLMMSHKDMRDEQKDTEGDPAIKQQRRARAVAVATKPLQQAIAAADVVICNPTHFAVALAWDRGTGRAPHCVAKGVDEMAARMRSLAVAAGVPLHADPPTARALHATLAIGQEIDRAHFPAVAAAIRFADLMRKKAKAR